MCSGHFPDSSGSWQCQKGEKAVRRNCPDGSDTSGVSGSLLSDSGLFDVLKFHCTSHDEYFNGRRNCDDSCSLSVHATWYTCGMADYRDPYGIRKAWIVYRAAALSLLDAGLSCKMAAGSICGDTDYYCSSGADEA